MDKGGAAILAALLALSVVIVGTCFYLAWVVVTWAT